MVKRGALILYYSKGRSNPEIEIEYPEYTVFFYLGPTLNSYEDHEEVKTPSISETNKTKTHKTQPLSGNSAFTGFAVICLSCVQRPTVK